MTKLLAKRNCCTGLKWKASAKNTCSGGCCPVEDAGSLGSGIPLEGVVEADRCLVTIPERKEEKECM
jgi:hypothetical protein